MIRGTKASLIGNSAFVNTLISPENINSYTVNSFLTFANLPKEGGGKLNFW